MSDPAHRTAFAAWLVAALCGLSGCSLYNGDLLDGGEDGSGASGGTSGSGAGGGGGAGTGPCVTAAETCNGVDDDCDGVIDDGASESCISVVLNADSSCISFEGEFICVMTMPQCHDGFDNCDGNPQNGCEASFCTCNPCEDASTDDAGEDDGGAADAGT